MEFIQSVRIRLDSLDNICNSIMKYKKSYELIEDLGSPREKRQTPLQG